MFETGRCDLPLRIEFTLPCVSPMEVLQVSCRCAGVVDPASGA